MSRYIDADALMEVLKSIPLRDLSDGKGLCRVIFEDDFKNAIKSLDNAPTADVAPVVHATWERKETALSIYGIVQVFECTNCGYDHEYNEWFDRCPNCGAKMDLEVQDE